MFRNQFVDTRLKIQREQKGFDHVAREASRDLEEEDGVTQAWLQAQAAAAPRLCWNALMPHAMVDAFSMSVRRSPSFRALLACSSARWCAAYSWLRSMGLILLADVAEGHPAGVRKVVNRLSRQRAAEGRVRSAASAFPEYGPAGCADLREGAWGGARWCRPS